MQETKNIAFQNFYDFYAKNKDRIESYRFVSNNNLFSFGYFQVVLNTSYQQKNISDGLLLNV